MAQLTPERQKQLDDIFKGVDISSITPTNLKSPDQKQIDDDISRWEAIARGEIKPNEKAPIDTRKPIDIAMGKNEPTAIRNKRNESIADITGGKEIAQGLGQGIANIKIGDDIKNIQNQQIEIQGRLLDRIREKKAQGQDTTRLESALNQITTEIKRYGDQADDLLNENDLTDRQIIGDALQLITTAGGAKVAGAVAGKATQATGIVKGAIEGGKAGLASGATLGTATGVSQALQDNADTGDVIKSGLEGGALGGLTGGVLGVLVGGASGLVKGIKFDKQNAYLKAVTPDPDDLTSTEYEKLLNKGKIAPKTANEPARYIMSEKELEVAEKYKSILGKDPVKNITNISDEILKKDKEVGQFLQKNNGIYNTGELKNSILASMDDLDDISIPEERIQKLKATLVDNFLKTLKKNDMHSLWEARKNFDSRIENAFKGSPTLQKDAKIALRNAVQDFIGERTPTGAYKGYMTDMRQLFNLKDVAGMKADSEKGKNAIELFLKRNENALKVLGALTAGGTIIGIGANSVKAYGE